MNPASPLPDRRREQIAALVAAEGSLRTSDLAARLGVTPMTLRRDVAALAERGLVRRVHGGIAAVDPSPPARPLTTVGMLVPSLDYYWPDVIRGADEAARTRGMRLAIRRSSYGPEDLSPHIDHLLEAGSAGVILVPTTTDAAVSSAIERLLAHGTPVVLVERGAVVGPLEEPVESVTTDHAHGAGLAIRHLAQLGHRRLGLLTARTSPTTRHVRRGWHEACALLPQITPTLDQDVPEPVDPDWGAACEDALDRCAATGTTALLIHADAAATALVQAADQRGVRIPQDLSLIAYDDEVAGLFTPRITAVHPPRRSLGRAAIELASARLEDPRRPAHRIVVSPSLRLRETTAPPA